MNLSSVIKQSYLNLQINEKKTLIMILQSIFIINILMELQILSFFLFLNFRLETLLLTKL